MTRSADQALNGARKGGAKMARIWLARGCAALLVTSPHGQYRRFNSIDVIYSMGAPDIFFSFAREDEARVAPVVAALEARGWSVFWDRRIPAGQTWRSHIGRALERARGVVVA